MKHLFALMLVIKLLDGTEHKIDVNQINGLGMVPDSYCPVRITMYGDAQPLCVAEDYMSLVDRVMDAKRKANE